MPKSEASRQLGAILWPPYDLPTRPAVRVLEYLTRPGIQPGPPHPLLFVGSRGGHAQVNLSRAEDAPTFCTKIDADRLIDNEWVEQDEIWTKRSKMNIAAYRLTMKGREAIAQYHARRRFKKEQIELAKRVLRECRANVRLS